MPKNNFPKVKNMISYKYTTNVCLKVSFNSLVHEGDGKTGFQGELEGQGIDDNTGMLGQEEVTFQPS